MTAQDQSTNSRNLSCVQCRKRKTKCDRKYPCGPCRLRGCSSSCCQVKQTIVSLQPEHAVEQVTSNSNIQHQTTTASSNTDYTTHAHEPSPGLSSDRISLVEQRLQRLEALITSALRNVPALLDDRAIEKTDANAGSNQNHDKARAKDKQVASVMGNEIQDLFEDLAMGHRSKRLPETQSWTRPMNETLKGTLVEHEQNFTEIDDEVVLNQRSSDAPVDIAFCFLKLCPDTEAALVLLDFYFDYVDWTTRVLHPQQAYHAFVKLAKMPHSNAATRFPTPTVCCYLIVLALGLHFASSDMLSRLGLSSRRAEKLADTLCTGCQQLLWASNFIGSQQLEHLACIVLLSVYQHNRKEQADAHWALLGTAIKVAQNLGLSRLDEANAQSVATLHPSLRSAAAREIGKRIWWNLVWLDWSHATAHYGVYAVHPNHNRTTLPRNVDVKGHDIQKAISDNAYTEASFTIFRIKYVAIYRQIVDARNTTGALGREQIEYFVQELARVHDSTPSCLRYRPDASRPDFEESPHQHMERLVLEMMYHNRMLRLHRSHQLAGYHQKEWSFARQTCLSSATSIITVIKSAVYRQRPGAGTPLLKYWLTTFYLLGAATALIMELCCGPCLPLTEVQSIREDVRDAIALLEQVGTSSEAARNSFRILSELLNSEQKIRQVLSKPSNVEKVSEAANSNDGDDSRHVFIEILQRALQRQPGHPRTQKDSRKRKARHLVENYSPLTTSSTIHTRIHDAGGNNPGPASSSEYSFASGQKMVGPADSAWYNRIMPQPPRVDTDNHARIRTHPTQNYEYAESYAQRKEKSAYELRDRHTTSDFAVGSIPSNVPLPDYSPSGASDDFSNDFTQGHESDEAFIRVLAGSLSAEEWLSTAYPLTQQYTL